jgi:hypothetical protein
MAGFGDDLDILVNRRQKSHQALDRIFPEMALEQAGDFWLAYAHLRAYHAAPRSRKYAFIA